MKHITSHSETRPARHGRPRSWWGHQVRWALAMVLGVAPACPGYAQDMAPAGGPQTPAQGQQQPPPPKPDTETIPLPPPQHVQPNDGSRLQRMVTPGVIGQTPRPTAKSKEKEDRYVQVLVQPDLTLDLLQDQTRLLILKQTPVRIQIANEGIATYALLSPTEISILGRGTGVTTLTFWFVDPADNTKQEILTYQVRVYPDPEAKARLERVCCALADEVNRQFPDSRVTLELCGDKWLLKGQARDSFEATQILRIVRDNAPVPPGARIPVDARTAAPAVADGTVAPGLDCYIVSGCAHIINLLKVTGEQQVMLRVCVAEVDRTAARSIGLNFALVNDNGQAYFANNTGSITTGGLVRGINGNNSFGFGNVANGFINTIPGVVFGAGGFNNLPVSLDNGQVNLAINALRVLNYAKALAEPNLVTLNGQTAHFHAGGSFPVPVVTGYTAAGLQGINYVPYGVQLSFTPYITDRDRIRLHVSAEVSNRDGVGGSSVVAGNVLPNLTTRNFQTVVELREGQTLAVAGLIQQNLESASHRVPLFGDLPLVGRFFAFDRIAASEQELVVLITPVLVHPMEPHQVPKLPGADLFEPGDIEFYLLGRLESRRDYDYRSPVMNDIHRMCRYRRCEQIYIHGPHGYCTDLKPTH
jgi:pilus assembly protein CpaC